MRTSGCGLLAGAALLIAAVAAGPAIGQAYDDEAVAGDGDRSAEIGVLAGVGFGQLGGDVSEAEARLGTAFGGFLNLPGRGALSVQAELMVVQKGAKEVPLGWLEYPWAEQEIVIVYGNSRLTYLELHLLAKRPVIIGENAYLLAGLAAGYLVHRHETLAREYEDDWLGPAERLTEENVFNTVGRGDAAALLGFGLAFPVGDSARLLLELRYEHGLLDVNRMVTGTLKNRCLTLLTGFSF